MYFRRGSSCCRPAASSEVAFPMLSPNRAQFRRAASTRVKIRSTTESFQITRKSSFGVRRREVSKIASGEFRICVGTPPN